MYRLGRFFARWGQVLIPHPLTVACVLSLGVIVLAAMCGRDQPADGAALGERPGAAGAPPQVPSPAAWTARR